MVHGSSTWPNACLRRGIAPAWAKPVPPSRHIVFRVSSVAYRHSWAAYQCPDPIAIIARRERAVLDFSPFSALFLRPRPKPSAHRLVWTPGERKLSTGYPQGARAALGQNEAPGTTSLALIRRTTLPPSHLAGWAHTRGQTNGRRPGIAAMSCYVTTVWPAALALLREPIRPSSLADFSAVPVKISGLHPISSPRRLIFFQHAHFAGWHRENMNKHPKWPFAAVREAHKLPQSEVNSRHNNDP